MSEPAGPFGDIPPQTIEVALGLARVFAELDEEAALKYVAEDFVDHEASAGVGGGPLGYLATARYMRGAFSDATWQPDDFFAAGDKFAVRMTFSGRHTGDFLGIPPTGREVRVQHLHFYRIAGGQAVEHWGARDELSLLRQIGVFTPEVPTPADAGAAAGD
ncbi:ester cyclase [Kutzneria buriramensis]|uniref:Putative ester cyclase n=1 Tax=Kutzneria buriramensis TaxID=1045776 RepID=A0A3E0HKM7_9PSEU|nr:ester cyclase [Kutzneria buriramensis]REH47034.1 putative ester cyclase [Kutzneria buriramensis]